MKIKKEELKITYEVITGANDPLAVIFDKLFTGAACFYTVVSGVLITTVSGVKPPIFG